MAEVFLLGSDEHIKDLIEEKKRELRHYELKVVETGIYLKLLEDNLKKKGPIKQKEAQNG